MSDDDPPMSSSRGGGSGSGSGSGRRRPTTNVGVGPSHRARSVESFKVMDVLRRANEIESSSRDGGGGDGDVVEVCHCEVGQPGSGAPRPVVRAAVEALTGGGSGGGGGGGGGDRRLGYTDAFGLTSLRTKISEHYVRKYPGLLPPRAVRRGEEEEEEVDDDGDGDDDDDGNTGGGGGRSGRRRVDADRIVVTTGSSGGFLLAFTACFDAGDAVAIASVGYPCYRNVLGALGCVPISVPVNADFKLTASELRIEIARRRKGTAGEEDALRGLILSSPGNPTGAMLSPDELRELCELCDEEGIRFISDEIYHGEFVA